MYLYIHTDLHTVCYAYTHPTSLDLVLVTNVSHFSMDIICVTDGYPRLC